LGKREESLIHYHRALSILDDGSESVELARAISAISRMHMVAAQYDEAVALGERALALSERLGAEDVTVHALNNIGVSLLMRDPDRGLAMLQDSLHRALALGLPYDTCRAYGNLSWGFRQRGRYSEARATYADLIAYAERTDAALFALVAHIELAELDWHLGHWTAALARRQRILELQYELPFRGRPGAMASALFGKMHTDLGQADAARAELESGLSAARSVADLGTTVPNLGQLTRAYAELGMESEAAALAQEIVCWIGTCRNVEGGCTMPLLFVCQWSAARAAEEGLDDTYVTLRQLERGHEQWDCPETDACLSEARGSVSLAEGHHREAVGFLLRAGARWEEMGRPYDQARALSNLGRALVGANDPEAAGAAFGQALDLYDSLAAQLEDANLKQSFRNSRPVREARKARATLQTPD
jgi:tetratricopeptide (TPR) repeat protein